MFLKYNFFLVIIFVHCHFINYGNFVLAQPMPPSKMYLLTISNTMEATIGGACLTDENNMLAVFGYIAKDLNIKIINSNISGNDFSKKSVEDAIKKIHPKKNDIVIIYYSGHGFSFQDDPTHIYPQLDLRTNPPVYNEDVIKSSTINIEEIFTTVKKKGARLNLVISDCCNSLIEFKRFFKNNNVGSQGYNEPINYEVATLLFLKTKASILTTAAAKGQYAVTDQLLGSNFTYIFSNMLNEFTTDLTLKEKDISWKKILENVKQNTIRLSAGYACDDSGKQIPCLQEPVFKIENK